MDVVVQAFIGHLSAAGINATWGKLLIIWVNIDEEQGVGCGNNTLLMAVSHPMVVKTWRICLNLNAYMVWGLDCINLNLGYQV